MGDLKPWQIVVIIAAVIAVGFTGWRLLTADRVAQPSGYMTVDVRTGQLYDIQKGKARGVVVPARHPETGERTLYPVNNENGTWKLDEGYAEHMPEPLKKAIGFTNAQNFQVKPDPPITFVLVK